MALSMRRLVAVVTVAAIVADVAVQGRPRNGVFLSGDMHLHSNHSTDALDNPMRALVEVALERGIDFFVITDHDNHVDGNLTTWDDPAYRDHNMTVLYGVEWTSGDGHANFFSAEPWDHPALYATRDAHNGTVVAEEAQRQGLVFTVNHPLNDGARNWSLGYDMDFDGIEIWQSLFLLPTNNQADLNLWEVFMDEGRRVTGRGGSDCHHQTGFEAQGLNVGNPTNWIYSADRSAEALLEGFKGGHVSVSYAPTAERIELWADRNQNGNYETLMGDNIWANGQEMNFKVRIEGFRDDETYRVAVFKNGAEWLSYNQTAPEHVFADTPQWWPIGTRSRYRVEVRGTVPLPEAPIVAADFYSDFIGFTNPIYVNFN